MIESMAHSSEEKPPGVPNDLPEDVRASYKPKMFEGSDVPGEAITRILGHEHLGEWSVGYEKKEFGSSGGEKTVDIDRSGSKEFVLRSLIGRGGFGEIWEATQVSLGRVVAVKRIRQDLFEKSIATDSTCRQVELSFHQEALMAANLDHPNIVPIYDLGRDDKGRTMLAMKRVRGRLWDEMIKEDREDLNEADFLAKHIPTLIDVAQAVAFAHSRGIVHRDIKPGQVMVGEFGEVLLMDWGLALVFDMERAQTEGLLFLSYGIVPTSEQATSPAGTIVFMAPEQTESSATNIGPWTDLFLLGGTLFFLLTDSVPHRAANNEGAFFKAMKGEMDSPREREPDKYIPQELNDLCVWAMDADRSKRLSNAKVFVDALQSYLGGASRKEESNRLADEAEEMLKDKAGYDELTRAMQAAEMATGLWLRNPRCPPILQKIDRRFSELALRNNDLVLARVHIMRLRDEQAREKLLKQLEERKERLRLSAHQRRFFRALTAIFLTFMIVGGVMYYLAQRRAQEDLLLAHSEMRDERDAAHQAREGAALARDQAENLINFMVADLSRQLAAMGRADLMNQITGEVLEYFHTGPDGAEESTVTLQNRGLAYQLAAQVQLAQGHPRQALEYLQVANSIAMELLAREPERAAFRHDLAESHLGLVQVYQVQKNLSEGLEAAQAAANIMDMLVESHPENREFRHALGRAHYFMSIFHHELGEADAAIPHFRRAEDIFSDLVTLDPESTEFRESLAQVYTTASRLLWLTGELREATELQEETTRLWEQVAEAEPWNVKLPEYIADSYSLTGILLNELEDLEEAEEAFSRSARLLEQLSNRDTESSSLRLTLAQVLNLQGNVLRQRDERERALEQHDGAKEIVNQLLDQDATNATARLELARTFTLLGMIRLEEDVPGAVRDWDRALAIYGEQEGDEAPLSTDFIDWHARTHILMGNHDEARPLLAELAARNHRRRELFELASKRGLVDGGAENYALVLID